MMSRMQCSSRIFTKSLGYLIQDCQNFKNYKAFIARRLLDLNRLLLSLRAQVSVLSSFTERAKTVTLLYGTKFTNTPL